MSDTDDAPKKPTASNEWNAVRQSYEEFVASAVKWNEMLAKQPNRSRVAKSSLSWLKDR
jgi:hypothetical protein